MKPYYHSKNCKLFHCDNLQLMKSMPDNYIDLIYCDVLYNTGKKFKDYNDNLGTPVEAVQWYEPRLLEMHRILKETGSIYIHCDYRLVHYLKVKMDEIFDVKNFQNEIIWCYNIGGKGKNRWARKHDNILFYTKSNNYFFDGKSNGTKRETRDYNSGTYGIGIDKDGRKYQDKLVKSSGKCYRYYLDEPKLPEDWWVDINSLQSRSKERLDYDTQKPKELLERIILASSNPNNVVADFFMGSGTSAEAAIEQGRKFIGCDISERACQITKERIQNILEKIQ